MNITTELHDAASNLDTNKCFAIIKTTPELILSLNEKGQTPLHCLLINFFSVHPDRRLNEGIKLMADLTRTMMQSSPKMLEHLPGLMKCCYHEDRAYYGCYPTQIKITAITVPEILTAVTSGAYPLLYSASNNC